MVEGGDKPEKTTESVADARAKPVEKTASKVESEQTAESRPPTLYELDEKLAKNAADVEPKVSLTRLVIGGVVLVVFLGSLLFVWVAWVETHQAFWSTAWVDDVTGDGWFNAARTSATFLAVVGIGGAAVVGYRRQQTLELTRVLEQRKHILGMLSQQTAADQAKTASEQLALDSRKYDLDRERQRTDRERDLRERFGVVVGQLDSVSATIQNAGLYALVALAEDWAAIGNDVERQVCIDLFSAHLRENSFVDTDAEGHPLERAVRRRDSVRLTASALLRRQFAAESGGWVRMGNFLNLAGVNLEDCDVSQVRLFGADFSNGDLGASLLVKSDLRRGRFKDADLSAVKALYANFASAYLHGSNLSHSILANAVMTAAVLENAHLNGAIIWATDFSSAKFKGADLTGVIYEVVGRDKPNFEGAIDLDLAAFDDDFAEDFATEIATSRAMREAKHAERERRSGQADGLGEVEGDAG